MLNVMLGVIFTSPSGPVMSAALCVPRCCLSPAVEHVPRGRVRRWAALSVLMPRRDAPPRSTVQHLVSLRLEGLFPRGCGNREVAASLVIRAPGGAAARLGEQRRFRPGWPRRNLGEHLLPVFTGRGALGSPAGAFLGDLSPRRFRLPSLSRHGTRDRSSLGGTRVNRQI